MPQVDAIELTRELIRIETVNPPGRELDCVLLLEAILQNNGFTITRHDYAPGRANLVATLGNDSGVPGLSFTGHVDTVPLGAAPWSYDPFGATIVDDRIYGRGSSDMKGGVAAFVAASCELAAAWPASRRLSLVVTADEETGCQGASALAAAHRFATEDILIVAEPTANVPVIGHKGVAWYKFKVKGRTAHGSMPHEGINAAYRAAELMLRLRDMEFNMRHEKLGRPTLSVGSVHAGANINSVPDLAEIAVDCRTVPGLDHGRLEELLTAELGDDDRLETLLSLESVWTDPQSPWVKEICSIADRVAGVGPAWQTATYFTDAAVLAPAMHNPSTIVLGPGEPAMAHKTDEYCSVSAIRAAKDIYVQIASRWLRH